VLDRLLDPLAHSLSPDAARTVVGFRASSEIQARLDELAEKSNEGQLTPDERREYEDYLEAIDFVAVLQAKAREALEHQLQS
jgi:hypothetical protein